MISSVSNNQIKNVIALVKRSKERRQQGLFVIEGIKMFEELPKSQLQKVFVSESFLKQKEREKLLADTPYELVSDDVLKAMSDTQTPQGILALAKQYHYDIKDMFPKDKTPFIMILETIQDPGNLGTILRAGEGAGITGVIMDANTVDIYNPKVIRSTMGSIYRVPFFYAEDLKELIKELKDKKVKLYASHLKAEHSYEEENYTVPVGFLIGNEASGLSDQISALADSYIKIPMCGKVESLNAAVASSILMFETARQRR